MSDSHREVGEALSWGSGSEDDILSEDLVTRSLPVTGMEPTNTDCFIYVSLLRKSVWKCRLRHVR